MSFLSLSPAAFAPFRLFVRHGKYVRFGVPGALGVKGWQEGQLAPCLGHGPNSCAGTPVMVASLFCSPPSPRGDATVLGGGAGGDRSHAGGGHGCYVPFAGAQIIRNTQLPFGWDPAVPWLSVNFQLNARRACFKLKRYCLNSVLHGIEDLQMGFRVVACE